MDEAQERGWGEETCSVYAEKTSYTSIGGEEAY
ncbi:hypothetical protein SDC9_110478 [bioreactor metagenome]|uniref:Uncharacterized protein n=1 Tax=bioreactor metagenome TaxID=1076179 RepID=A0A645BE26_9ZZZZ